MANLEQLDLIRQGAAVWNAWRVQNRERHVDLRGVDLRRVDLGQRSTYAGRLQHISQGIDLRGADLSGANLGRTNLIGADLVRADLIGADLVGADLGESCLSEAHLGRADLRGATFCGANLRGADLRGASLVGANLCEADLDGAEFRKADLRQANLSGASLVGANLREVRLRGANLTGARLYETLFADVDLSATKGLDECAHSGPSILDHRTLQRSGRLPLVFLRGCGLPDRLIEYLPSLLEAAIQYYSCFISYSSKDQSFADRLHADLQNAGVRCWFAPEDMKIGEKFRQRIDEAIHVHERLLLILSENSVSSEWVEKEVETAFDKEQRQKRTVLFPVRLDDAVLECRTGWSADIRRTRHIGDFRSGKTTTPTSRHSAGCCET